MQHLDVFARIALSGMVTWRFVLNGVHRASSAGNTSTHDRVNTRQGVNTSGRVSQDEERTPATVSLGSCASRGQVAAVSFTPAQACVAPAAGGGVRHDAVVEPARRISMGVCSTTRGPTLFASSLHNVDYRPGILSMGRCWTQAVEGGLQDGLSHGPGRQG